MRTWDAARIAAASGARLLSQSNTASGGPRGVVIDTRAIAGGELFIGLPGSRVDGGAYVAAALDAGAWGVLAAPKHAEPLAAAADGTVLSHADPLAALQGLAHGWREELKAHVVAITGSTGKTSTKDILAALLSTRLRTFASPANHNTEIGLPLAILAAPADSQALVLEMAMRGAGQIAELVRIAEPDIGVITNIGPVHLELLGTVEAIAAAKAELLAGLPAGATAVIPAGEQLLSGHLREELNTVTFGDGGDTTLLSVGADSEVVIRDAAGELTRLRPSFSQPHNLRNLLAATAAARALGVKPEGPLHVAFSALRGERLALSNGITLINDCYNANPLSMRAALDDLAASAQHRRVAVLGDMLELGRDELRYHREIGAYAAASKANVLVAVGPLAGVMGDAFDGEFHAVADAPAAAKLLLALLRHDDTVLVKGSRSVGMERIAQILLERGLDGDVPSPIAAGTPKDRTG